MKLLHLRTGLPRDSCRRCPTEQSSAWVTVVVEGPPLAPGHPRRPTRPVHMITSRWRSTRRSTWVMCPLPGPGDPVDPLRGSRIESIKRHPTDPELALVTRTNPDQVVGPFASVSVEFYDEAVAEGREWGLALEEQLRATVAQAGSGPHGPLEDLKHLDCIPRIDRIGRCLFSARATCS